MGERPEIHGAWAQNTIRAYRSDWKQWETFAQGKGFDVLPADSDGLVAFVQNLVRAGRTLKVVERKTYAIGRLHEESGFENPVKSAGVSRCLMGARMMLQAEPKKRKSLSDFSAGDLVARLESSDASWVRDKALVLLIHATEMRTCEVAALRFDDLTFLEDGLEVRIRKEVNRFRKKENVYLFLPCSDDEELCVVRAVEDWADGLLYAPGSPVFRAINRHGQISTDAMSARGIRYVLGDMG